LHDIEINYCEIFAKGFGFVQGVDEGDFGPTLANIWMGGRGGGRGGISPMGKKMVAQFESIHRLDTKPNHAAISVLLSHQVG
jgi:hypothetical protein